jgi:hypothetical protein
VFLTAVTGLWRSERVLRTPLSLVPASAGLLLDFLYDSEDEGCVFLRNVGLSPIYTALITVLVYICFFLLPLCHRMRMISRLDFPCHH